MIYSSSILINEICRNKVSLFDFQRIVNDENLKNLMQSGEVYGEFLDKDDYNKMSSKRMNTVDKDKAIIRILELSLEVSTAKESEDKFIVVKYESTGAHPYYDKILSDKYMYQLNLRLGKESIDGGNTFRPGLVAIDVIPKISMSIGNKLRYERLFNKK